MSQSLAAAGPDPTHAPQPGRAAIRRLTALALPLPLLGLALLGGPGAAEARTVTYKNVLSPSKLINCYSYVQGRTPRIECMAPYLPDVGDTDAYLALRPRGRAILSGRSDYPGGFSRRRTLRYGDVWARPGVRCVMRRRGLTCRNRDRHGFHIQKGNVRQF